MDLEHCDTYEIFVKELVFGDGIQGLANLAKLYENAVATVEPLAENVTYTEEEEIQDAMDDCWDTEWINPLTGVPHYHTANQDITSICIGNYNKKRTT